MKSILKTKKELESSPLRTEESAQGNYRFNFTILSTRRTSHGSVDRRNSDRATPISTKFGNRSTASDTQEKTKQILQSKCNKYIYQEFAEEVLYSNKSVSLEVRIAQFMDKRTTDDILDQKKQQLVTLVPREFLKISSPILESIPLNLKSFESCMMMEALSSISEEFKGTLRLQLVQSLQIVMKFPFAVYLLLKLAKDDGSFRQWLFRCLTQRNEILFESGAAIEVLNFLVGMHVEYDNLDFLIPFLKLNRSNVVFDQAKSLLITILERNDKKDLDILSSIVENNVKWIADKPIGCVTFIYLLRRRDAKIIQTVEKLFLEYPIQTFVRRYRRIMLLEYVNCSEQKEAVIMNVMDSIRKKASNLAYVLKRRESMVLFLHLFLFTLQFTPPRDSHDVLDKCRKICRQSSSEGLFVIGTFLLCATRLAEGADAEVLLRVNL